jgi:mRNA deadenylase 3'-5' endonuclease subunit Ccr4
MKKQTAKLHSTTKTNRKTKKRTKPSNIFTIMTFNVELFLNLYHFDKTGDEITSSSIIPSKLKQFKQLFKNIDIACLQEIYIPGITTNAIDTSELRIFDNAIQHLQLHSICKSHKLDWAKSEYLYGSPSYLANAVYISNKIHTISSQSQKINRIGLDRCYSSSVIQIGHTPITIMCVHLIGGRFDDIEAIQDDAYTEEKLNQVKQIVAAHPDIICGDFNTKIRTPIVEAQTDTYFESLLANIGPISEYDKELYKSRWEKWIFMDIIHAYLTKMGYASVYYSDDGLLNTTITDTSAYGGIVDMIYYKSTSIKLVSKAEIVGIHSVMDLPESGHIYKPLLSDHYPIKAKFVLV